MLLLIEMAAAQDSYFRLLAEWHRRDDYRWMFRSRLGKLVADDDVDFSWVKTCVAFGTGSGDDELEFARSLLPNLRAFIAVEFDRESIKALRANFQAGQLPGVETTVMETSLENWNGVDSPVDCVLLFNVLFHVTPEDRRKLFEKLTCTRYLNAGGLVVIVENESADASGFMRLMKRLGNPEYKYRDIEEDMLAAGFSLVLTRSIKGKRDLFNPSEYVLKYVELLLQHAVSREEIRTAIADIFGQPHLCTYNKRLAVFQNLPCLVARHDGHISNDIKLNNSHD